MSDLARLFLPDLPPLELVLRGSVMYWFLFLLFRFVLRRDPGALGIADILLLVLIADASQNAMAGGYDTIFDGMVLVGTIAGWCWLTDWAAYRWNAVRRFADPPPLLLIRRGRIMAANLRRERVTVPELMAALREHGVAKLNEVQRARMESDGTITVIREPAVGRQGDESGSTRRPPLP